MPDPEERKENVADSNPETSENERSAEQATTKPPPGIHESHPIGPDFEMAGGAILPSS